MVELTCFKCEKVKNPSLNPTSAYYLCSSNTCSIIC